MDDKLTVHEFRKFLKDNATSILEIHVIMLLLRKQMNLLAIAVDHHVGNIEIADLGDVAVKLDKEIEELSVELDKVQRMLDESDVFDESGMIMDNDEML